MLAMVMLGDDLPGNPLVEEAAGQSCQAGIDEHAGRAGLTARIDAHCRYWSDIRASGAPRMLDSWRAYAGSLLEEGRTMIARFSEETETRFSTAIESLRRSFAIATRSWAFSISAGHWHRASRKVRRSTSPAGAVSSINSRPSRPHTAANPIDHDLEPAVAHWLNLDAASLERRAEIETFISEARALPTSPDGMEHVIRRARAMTGDRERYGVHLDHMADTPLVRLVTELKARQQRSIHRSLGNSM